MPARIIVTVSLDPDVLSGRHLEEVDIAVGQLQALPGACVSGWGDSPVRGGSCGNPDFGALDHDCDTHRSPSPDG